MVDNGKVGTDLAFLLMSDMDYYYKELKDKYPLDVQLKYLEVIINYFLDRF